MKSLAGFNISLKMDKQKAFTLIELLVVIAIIAMLLAIILPALRLAKEQARNAICKAHLRGLGVTVIAYLEENDNTFHDIPNQGLWEDPDTGEELSADDPLAYWGIAYSYYADNKEIFTCPSTVVCDYWMLPGEPYNGWPIKTLEEMYHYCHYGVNGYIAGTSQIRKITEYKVPASVIFAQDHSEQTLDGANSDMYCIGPNVSINLTQWRDFQRFNSDIYPAAVSDCFRHVRSSYARKRPSVYLSVEKGSANNLWLDGHVSPIEESLGEDVQVRWYTGDIADPALSRWDQ